MLDEELRNQQAPRKWSPGVAAVLSLVIPGAGQMYKGDIATGFVLLLFTVLGYMAFVLPGLGLHIYSVYSAYTAPAPGERRLLKQTSR